MTILHMQAFSSALCSIYQRPSQKFAEYQIKNYIYQNRSMPYFSRIFFYLLTGAAVFSSTRPFAQSTAVDSSRRAAAIHSTAREYQRFISTAAPLYSGPQYVEYYQQINEGHPFFLNIDFNTGSVRYDNILYEKVPLKYDIIQNKIVLLNASGVFRLSPSNDRIDYFTILNHTFIKIEKDSSRPSLPKSGFYEVLFGDQHLVLLRKETKSLQEDLNLWVTPRRYVESAIHFYIQKGNTYYAINRKTQVLDLFKDRKAELRQFIRKNKLDFKRDTDNALVSIVTYYESLVK